MTDVTLPSNYEALRALCETQQSQLSHQQAFIQNLLEQIRLSRHQHFGSRSEGFRQWPTLIVYVEHGDLRIDNNVIENARRPRLTASSRTDIYGMCLQSYPRRPVWKTLRRCCRIRWIRYFAYASALSFLVLQNAIASVAGLSEISHTC